MTTERAAIVIPCFNEAARIDRDEVYELIADSTVDVYCADDGSTDRTREVLHDIATRDPDRIRVLGFDQNRGKAEVVRDGLGLAMRGGATWVGYLDADFATPAQEMLRLLAIARRSNKGVVLASRVSRLGADVERSTARHTLGRVFATLAASALDLRVYDTQCGAKWFRSGPELRNALERPFEARWVFDVELLGRLVGRIGEGPAFDVTDVLEVPTDAWRDVRGSKLRLPAMARSLLDVGRVWRKRLEKQRR